MTEFDPRFDTFNVNACKISINSVTVTSDRCAEYEKVCSEFSYRLRNIGGNSLERMPFSDLENINDFNTILNQRECSLSIRVITSCGIRALCDYITFKNDEGNLRFINGIRLKTLRIGSVLKCNCCVADEVNTILSRDDNELVANGPEKFVVHDSEAFRIINSKIFELDVTKSVEKLVTILGIIPDENGNFDNCGATRKFLKEFHLIEIHNYCGPWTSNDNTRERDNIIHKKLLPGILQSNIHNLGKKPFCFGV